MPNKLTTPPSSAGLVQFYDAATGGPTLDPVFVLFLIVGFIVLQIIARVVLS